MGILDQIRADIAQITTNDSDFAIPMTFETPDGNTTAEVKGIGIKHHLAIDRDSGNAVNSKTANISVVESVLLAADYPVRDASGEVNLRRHKVSWTDSTGVLGKYEIREWFPDETVGLIVCILGDFEQ